MSSQAIAKTAVCGLVMFAIVCGAAFASDVEDNLTYQGNKARVVVGTIKPKADMCSNEMAAAIGEMLSTALFNTGKFIVLASQEEVAELAEEIDFAQSGYVEQGKGPEAGLMEGADILITGAVTSFEPDAGGGGGGLSGLKKKAFGSLGVSSKKAKMQMELKLIDIRTRRIIKAKKIKAESKSWSTDMTGGGWTDDISLDGALDFQRSPEGVLSIYRPGTVHAGVRRAGTGCCTRCRYRSGCSGPCGGSSCLSRASSGCARSRGYDALYQV